MTPKDLKDTATRMLTVASKAGLRGSKYLLACEFELAKAEFLVAKRATQLAIFLASKYDQEDVPDNVVPLKRMVR